MAVVDSYLRVRGIQRLRAVDGFMPRITSGCTNSPTLMIAEKGGAVDTGWGLVVGSGGFYYLDSGLRLWSVAWRLERPGF